MLSLEGSCFLQLSMSRVASVGSVSSAHMEIAPGFEAACQSNNGPYMLQHGSPGQGAVEMNSSRNSSHFSAATKIMKPTNKKLQL